MVELLRALVERPAPTVERVEVPVFSPVAAPVAPATDMQHGEKKVRERVVKAAMPPRDYVNQYLDEHPNVFTRLEVDKDFGYRELAADIAKHYSMDFDHSTVYRAVKKRQGKR
jgi:hypothetical protein